MKYLALALLLCALTSLSNAACYHKVVLPAIHFIGNTTHLIEDTTNSTNATHCQDDVDKTWHVKGSRWRNSQCHDCDCDECCAAFSTPRKFPDDCVSVFDQKACKYIVHKKDDPTVLCPVYVAVGK